MFFQLPVRNRFVRRVLDCRASTNNLLATSAFDFPAFTTFPHNFLGAEMQHPTRMSHFLICPSSRQQWPLLGIFLGPVGGKFWRLSADVDIRIRNRYRQKLWTCFSITACSSFFRFSGGNCEKCILIYARHFGGFFFSVACTILNNAQRINPEIINAQTTASLDCMSEICSQVVQGTSFLKISKFNNVVLIMSFEGPQQWLRQA